MTTLRNCRALLILALLTLLAFSVVAHAAPVARAERAPRGGKPVAPIAIDYTFAGDIALGRATTIVVTIVPERRLDDAVVTLGAAQGLVLNGPPSSALGSVAGGRALELRVSVTPLVPERLRLAVTVAGHMDSAQQVRTISIPLRLAAAPEKSPAELKLDADGELLHALPAARPPRGILR